MNTQLIAGQPIPLTPDGNWLYLKAAQAEIEIYRESSGERVTLGKSSVFNVGEGKHLGRLLISSRTDNEIEIQFGYGSFMPPVEFKAPQPVNVQSLPAVTLEATQVVKVDEQVSSNLITEAVSVFPHNMAQNATRKAITIKASKANTASVFVDAFELEAGERITIESTAAMTLTGSAGDTVTIMEI
ncbi:TPA: hypothetical protein NKV59_003400 [Vibrio parahaemolyticus]|nr:hypothetical protein [Vibrio parahaemolyticus]